MMTLLIVVILWLIGVLCLIKRQERLDDEEDEQELKKIRDLIKHKDFK